MQKLQTVNAETLLYEPLEKPSFVVDSLIPTGLSLFCGSQKIGKSWLMLKLCLCVSQGIPLWDMPTMEGDVLYLCLEDTFCRIQDRLFRLTDEASGRLHFAVASCKLSDGLIVQLEDYLKDYPDSRLIVIDTLQKVRTASKDNAYASDYGDISLMANWCIRLAEEYLSILYDHLHEELYSYHVIQADETPVLVNHDGRKAGSKSWMWVYRSGHLYQDRQIVLYEYQQTRNASHPREFLKGYDGICVTDGYQVYHTLEKELEELTIAGCWVHCRRRFDEALKLIPKPFQKESKAFLLMKQIQAIYREEGKLNDLSSDERLKQRQAVIKPLVDAFFAYLKTVNVSKKDKFGDAVRYALNQEKYLRVFLTDGDVPIDNNASERAIRGFCIGKKNWQMIDTIHGAKSSAIIYSIVETAKANNLKPFDYVQHLLEEIPKHMNDKDCSFLEDLLPWSEKLPAGIRKA